MISKDKKKKNKACFTFVCKVFEIKEQREALK